MKLMCIRGSLITCILFMSRQRVVKNVYEIDVNLIIRFNSEAFTIRYYLRICIIFGIIRLVFKS